MSTATRSRGKRSLTTSPKNARTRRLLMESLEERRVLTAYLFIDYGDNFPSGTLSTTQRALYEVADAPAGTDKVLGVGLEDADGNFPTAPGDNGARIDINAQTFTATERAEMLAIIQRAYRPLDITVVELTATAQVTADGRTVAGATSMNDVVNTLRGGNSASKDAYIFVGEFIVDPGGTNERTSFNFGGTSPGGEVNGPILGEQSDLGAAQNAHDDVAIVFSGGGLDTNTLNNISHEAGHLFGLRHAITDITGTPATNLFHEAEIMSYRNTNNTTSSLFTRFPMIQGDSNSPGYTDNTAATVFDASARTITRPSDVGNDFDDEGFVAGLSIVITGTANNDGTYVIQSVTGTVITLTAGATLTNETGSTRIVSLNTVNYNSIASRAGQVTIYDQMRLDAGIQANPNFNFVSGTGAHDIITITRNGANANVTIQAFADAAYTTPIIVPGQVTSIYSYSIPLDKAILVYAGGSDDRIAIDADLGVNVEIDGMLGTDSLIVDGKGAANINYSPNLTSPDGVDLVESFGGTVTTETGVITFYNYEVSSLVTIQNVTAVTYDTLSTLTDQLFVNPYSAGDLQVTGSVNAGTEAIPLRVPGVNSLIVNGAAGNDVFSVRPSSTTTLYINGGAPVVGDPGVPPGDVLAVDLVGIGNASVPRNATDGVITSNLQPIYFTSIETLIASDRFEINDTQAQATDLGSEITTIERDLSIHSADDEDWFKITAHSTGSLAVNIKFLQAIGDLDFEIYDASGDLIATADALVDNERLSIPVIAQQTYFVRIYGFDGDINNYSLEIENFAAPIPTGAFLDPDSDTGRSNSDRITNDTTPTFFIQADLLNFLDANNNDQWDAGEISVLTAAELAARNTPGLGIQVILTNITDGSVVNGFATPQYASAVNATFPFVYTFTPTTPLADGTYVLTAATRVVDGQTPNVSARTVLSAPLVSFTIDTIAPPVSILGFSSPSDDSGSAVQPITLSDFITNVTSLGFRGNAEMNALVRLYADSVANGAIDINTLLGSAVATPQDGNQSGGTWLADLLRNLNDAAFGARDGVREILATAQDAAGNTSAPVALTIFVDTQGPQMYDPAGPQRAIFVPGFDAYDIFAPKGSNGPTPGVTSLGINVRDLPNRADGFLYAALIAQIATNPGHYRLVGDHSGEIAISSVAYTQNAVVAGQPATGVITLNFGAALPDDRFTLYFSDELIDPAGNRFDGESNAIGPNETPAFPSGDGAAGGAFVARFTVDSRPEIGNYAGGAAFIDINGNMVFDPQGGGDSTNRDLVFQMGTLSDGLFSGKFEPANLAANDNDGFDKLGAYGYNTTARHYRFLLDFNHDGVFDQYIISPYQVNGIAVAGNFAAARPGDEIGLFDGENWYIDTNGDNQLDTKIASNMRGLPLVGDFNGDGNDDFATYDAGTNTFYFDTNRNGQWDNTLPVGGPLHGFNDRALAGDWNLDGIDDLVLVVPPRQGSPNSGLSEWYILVSDRKAPGLLPSQIFDPYSPSPLGNDVFAQLGDQFTLPVFGNFDPPLVQPTVPVAADSFAAFLSTNPNNPQDVDGDGLVTPTDAVLVINSLNASGGTSFFRSQGSDVQQASLDVSGDGFLAPLDALLIINYLNAGGQSEPAAQREVAAAPASDAASPATGDEATAASEVATYFHDLGDAASQPTSSTDSASQAADLAAIAADIYAPLPPWYFTTSEAQASSSAGSDSDEGDEYWDELAEDLALAWSE